MNELQPEYNIKTEGCGISDEAREKLRKLKTGVKRPDISRQVKCVETGEVFESIRAAAKWCNVPNSNIVILLKGKGRTAGGYHWIYTDEDEEAQLERIRQMPEGNKATEETREKIRQSHLGQGWKPSTYEKCCRKIRCVETGEIFDSIKTAAEHYGLKRPNISAVLAGKNKTSGGFHWEYVDGQPPQSRSEEFRKKIGKPVRCVETGVVYESLTKAAEVFGVSYSAIANAVNGLCETSCGFHWEFAKENPPTKQIKKPPKTTAKSIRCVETQEVFKSLREAAEFFGIHSSGIGHALNGRNKTAGGCHWEFVMP